MARHTADQLRSVTFRKRSLEANTAENPHPYFVKVQKNLGVGYRKNVNGGTWIARQHSGDGKYTYAPLGSTDDYLAADGKLILTFDQAQQAAIDWANRQHAIATGAAKPSEQPYTVAEAMEDYVAAKEREKRKKLPRTRQTINAHILPILGSMDVHKLKAPKLRSWRDALADAAPRVRSKVGKPQAFREFDADDQDAIRARQASVNRILTVLKAALNLAYEEQKVTSDAEWSNVKPFRKVDVPKVRFLTQKEAAALLKACANDFKPLVQAALVTGCRYGELKAMAVGAYDANNRSVYVAPSKNGDARHVLLNADGAAFFDNHTREKKSSDPMFMRSNSKRWEDSEQKRPMDAACAKAKLEQVTFHILRHTYASLAVMNGAPMQLIASQLGHKSTRITERHYAHLGDAYKRQTIDRVMPSFGFLAAAGTSDGQAPVAAAKDRRKGRLLRMA